MERDLLPKQKFSHQGTWLSELAFPIVRQPDEHVTVSQLLGSHSKPCYTGPEKQAVAFRQPLEIQPAARFYLRRITLLRTTLSPSHKHPHSTHVMDLSPATAKHTARPPGPKWCSLYAARAYWV